MPMLKWDDKYLLNVKEMDAQHQRWLEMLNEFYDHLSNGGMKENLAKLLDEAIKYTDYHFSEEEKFMQSIGYPNLNDQKERHQKIRRTLQEYRQKIAENHVVVSMPITNEMKSWFSEHIQKEDRGYGDYYAKLHG